ncbi:hypothetical protein [Lentibacillus jeotgali]|uniref:hypothetical protein n=1 Tax=Lentibacillus jeotgali TaxID=558169 RepID=UPI0002627415|nr:hypothetical protein [Lentibacillus jeotgali]
MTKGEEVNDVFAKRIATNPDPMERFNISQGFRVGDFLVVSGQTANNEHGELIGPNNFGTGKASVS